MNRRILLASYAIIGAQMMAAATPAPRPTPTPAPEPPLPVRDLYREIDPMQAALNRQSRLRAGFKGRR